MKSPSTGVSALILLAAQPGAETGIREVNTHGFGVGYFVKPQPVELAELRKGHQWRLVTGVPARKLLYVKKIGTGTPGSALLKPLGFHAKGGKGPAKAENVPLVIMG